MLMMEVFLEVFGLRKLANRHITLGISEAPVKRCWLANSKLMMDIAWHLVSLRAMVLFLQMTAMPMMLQHTGLTTRTVSLWTLILIFAIKVLTGWLYLILWPVTTMLILTQTIQDTILTMLAHHKIGYIYRIMRHGMVKVCAWQKIRVSKCISIIALSKLRVIKLLDLLKELGQNHMLLGTKVIAIKAVL